MAATLLQEISQDEHEKARIRSRRMYEMDKYSDYHTAIEIGEIRSNEKWQGVVAKKDAEIANKDKVIADKNTVIARLQAQLDSRE